MRCCLTTTTSLLVLAVCVTSAGSLNPQPSPADDTVTPPGVNDVTTHRHRHHRTPPPPPEHRDNRDSDPSATTGEPPLGEALKPSRKRYKCGFTIRDGCTCTKRAGTLSITCFKAGLRKVPLFDFGPIVVRTMNLQRNKIQAISIGDFYGLKIERLLLANNSLTGLNFLAFWGLEYNLDTLDLSFNKFTRVPAVGLRLLRNVRTLSLSGNRIQTLSNYDFSYLHKLEVLSLDHNPISFMEARTFHGTNMFMLILDRIDLTDGLQIIPTGDLAKLKGLSLKRNGIREVPDGWFRNLTSLKLLNLDENKLDHIAADTFAGVGQTLRTLQISHNKLRKVPRKALRALPSLEKLDLSYNKVRKLLPRSFNNSRALHELDLSHNAIYDMSVSAFEGTDSLLQLDIRYNTISLMDERTFYWDDDDDDVPGRKVYISENPVLCNCWLKWLKKAHRKKLKIANLFADILDVRCSRPHFCAGKQVIKVPLREFTCDHDYYYYGDHDYDYYYYENEGEDEEDGGGGYEYEDYDPAGEEGVEESEQ